MNLKSQIPIMRLMYQPKELEAMLRSVCSGLLKAAILKTIGLNLVPFNFFLS